MKPGSESNGFYFIRMQLRSPRGEYVRQKVPGFKSNIYYFVRGDEIVVFAVMHQRQHPDPGRNGPGRRGRRMNLPEAPFRGRSSSPGIMPGRGWTGVDHATMRREVNLHDFRRAQA